MAFGEVDFTNLETFVECTITEELDDEVASLIKQREEARNAKDWSLADRLRADRMLVYGPSAAAARLEGSKAFTNEILEKYNLTSKSFVVLDDPDEVVHYIKKTVIL